MEQRNVLVLTSVASMIDQFIMPNIELLLEMGYKVDVACNFIEGNTCPADQINILQTNLSNMDVSHYQIDFKRDIKKVLDNNKAYHQVLEIMKKTKYEFIHCHSPIGGVCGRLAGKATNTKVIYTAHGFHFYKGAPLINWIVYYPVEKYLSRYTDCLITINEEDYNIAINKHFKANKIKMIHGVGIDLNKFNPQTVEKKNLIRKKYGYKEDDFILFYAAELNYNKHQDILINAINILKDKIPTIKLLLAGKGPLDNKYKEQANSLGIECKIEFLGYRNDITYLLMLSDMAVSSSRREGLGMNVVEAMATRLPLVVSNVRGHRYLVTNGENGYIIGTDNAREFAKAIKRIYHNDELRKKFSIKNTELVQKYSLENVLSEIEMIYNEL